jgi:hypothetical protein
MKTKKVVWLSAFKHVIPADYENWLEEMASQGWNIDRIGQWSSVRMVFTKSTPKKYRYVYDIQTNPKKDYRATYEQFGWEFVGIMASCFLWRKEYSSERPEAFSDLQSIENRNNSVVKAVSVSLIIFISAFMITLIALGVTFRSLAVGDTIQLIMFLLFSGGIGVYLAWIRQKIYKNRYK